jgi:condensin-2 complex subunit D3
VRAYAVVTLGKLCLRDKALARQHVNVFLRELVPEPDQPPPQALTAAAAVAAGARRQAGAAAAAAAAAVRSNALLVLGDLCVRYTSLVDRYSQRGPICAPI